MRKENMVQDMTKGNPMKLLVFFALPMLLGNIFQQVYSLVDTIIVGKYLGEDALAGIGSTGTVTSLMLCLIFGLCNGAGIVMAQCFGGEKYDQLRKAVTALIYITGTMGLFVTISGKLLVTSFIKILGIPEEIAGYSSAYLQIRFTFIIGSMAYNAASSILRSVGDSKTPLYSLIVGSILNIVLDLTFILEWNMGIEGASYATVISQWVTAVICIFYLYRHRQELHISGLKKVPEKKMILLIFKTGVPSAFQSGAISIGSMSVQRLINSYGEATMAAYAAATKLDNIAIQVIVSLGASMSVFTGQNMGQRNFKRIQEGLRVTLRLMMISSISIAVLVLALKGQAMHLFLDADAAQEAIKIGEEYLSIIGIAYVIAGIMQSYQNLIRGAGDVNVCMIAGLAELSARIFFAYLLSPILGKTGIWLATPLSWGCGCIIPVVRYYTGKWKGKMLVEEQKEIEQKEIE